jgi:hypothetical protein
MRKTDYRIFNIRFLLCIILLLGLCGCAYQATLLDPQQVEAGSGVIVRCNVVKEPVIKVSQSGDFIFWWAGGPGPITYSVATVVNERNNDLYRKRLKPVLETDYFCGGFEANLKDAIEENGLRIEQMSIEHVEAGIPVLSDVQKIDILGPLGQKGDHKYVLQLNISCGLFKSEAQTAAQLEGQLTKRTGNKVIWKNKLSFEGQAGGEHKKYGHGNEAIKKWEEDDTVLRDCLMEVIDGVTELLARELTGTTEQQHRELTKLELKDGSKIKGHIIDESQERLVVRLEGGSVRSMPAENLVNMN